MKGSCLCGAVTWGTEASPDRPAACHCGQCRKQSGHVWASASVREAELTITGEPRWYRASDIAQRGFCPACGSFLFWKHDDEDTISVSLGSVDGPTGLTLGRHIFTRWKGDYYEIADGVAQS